ncbi:ROK family transcriptional regulator [Streptomyces sp. NPDC002004]
MRWAAGADVMALRGHNAALVLDLLRTAGEAGISRLELAERTGLTPQAVSKITARLRGDGLAVEAGRRASTGGKPATVLQLVPEAGHAVGVHLDRDELTAVLVDLVGGVVAERSAPLDLGAGAGPVLDAVAVAVEDVVEGLEAGGGGLLGVGVALPGPLDHRLGVLQRVTGYPEWDGFPLREALAARLGLPVVVDKDTNAAALGIALALAVAGEPAQDSGPGYDRAPGHDRAYGHHHAYDQPYGNEQAYGQDQPYGQEQGRRQGHGKGHGSFAYLHLGTGLGAGLVLDGDVYRGPRTAAGEFGHQVIQLDGPVCECGNRGCVEALCLRAVARGAGDEAARVLGVAAANLVALLDIDLVLLGGRVVTADEEQFVRGVGAVLEEHALREGTERVPVRVAPGGARGIADGAAQLVLAPLFGRAGAAEAG